MHSPTPARRLATRSAILRRPPSPTARTGARTDASKSKILHPVAIGDIMRACIECFLCNARTGTDDPTISPDELAREKGWARVTDPQGETILYICDACILRAMIRSTAHHPHPAPAPRSP